MARTFDEMMADIEKSAKEREVKVEAEKAAAASPAAARYPAYTLPPPEPAAKPRAQKAVSAAPPAPGLTPPAAPRQPEAQVSAPKPPKPPKVQPALAPPEPPKAEIVIPPDVKRDIDYKRFYNRAGGSLEYAKEAAASQFGMSVKELENVASAQGVDLEAIHDQKIKGRTFEEVAAAARQRGTLGFLPVAEREAIFRNTVEDVERAERGEAKTDIPMVQSIEDEGMLQGYFAPGLKREFDSVSQPGEYGYLTSTLLVNALKKDPEASRIWDLYGRGLATGNTQKYIEERAQDLMKRAGVGPNDPAAQDKYKAFRKRATNEVLAYKTIGQWTPAITMQDVQVTEGVEAPGFFAATGPNVELVGINNRGQAVFRQESALSVGFRFIDMPQAALVGTIQGQGAAAGVQTAANFMELALEGTKDAPTPVKIGAGVLGFAGAVLFPDLLLAAGAVPRAGRAMKGAYLIRKHGAEAVKLLETISVARRAGNYADAITAEQKLRRLVPGVADALDEGDAHAASVMGVVDPDTDILKDDMAAVFAAHVPAEKRLAAERIFLHPSVRKDKLSGKMLKRDVPMSVYSELYNTDELIRRVDDAVASYTARMPKSVDEYAAMYSRGATRDVLRPAVDSGIITAQQADELSDIVASVAPRALADMDDFATELRTALKAHPEFSQGKYNVVRQSLHAPGASRLRNVLDRKLKAIRGKAVADLQAPDLALFDRMKKGIVRSSEARGIAASLLRDEVAEIAKVKVQPLKAFDDVALVAPDGTPLRLSAGGTLFLRQLREALPKQDFQEAYAISVGVDAIVAKRAKNAGIDSFRVYSELLPQIRSATAEELQKFGRAVKAGGTPPAAPAAPTAAAAPPPAVPAAAAVSSKVAAALTKVNAPAHVIQMATRPVTLEKGWTLADVASAAEGKTLLEQSMRGRIPGSSFVGTNPREGVADTLGLTVGDAKVYIYAPDDASARLANTKFDVVVAVGDATPRRIPGVTADWKTALERGIVEAEKMMDARVKKGEPAIKGAQKAPAAAAPAPAPTPAPKAAPAAPAPTPAALPPPPPPALPPPPPVLPPVPPATKLPPPPPQPLPPPPPKLPPPPPPTILPPVPLPPVPATAAAALEAASVENIAEAVARVRAASGEAPSAAGIEELARAAEEAGLPVRRTAEGGFDVIVDPFRNVATADIVGRLESSLTETRVAVEELRRAVDSGAVGALDEYIDAAREHRQALSGGVGRVMERALRGDEDAVEFIVRLGDEIDQLDVSAAATRAKAGRPAAPFFSVDELEGLRAARATEQAELRAARAAPAAKAAETTVEAAPEAAPAMSRVEALRKAVETEERAVKAAKGAVKTRRTQQLKMLQAELASAEAKAAKVTVSAAPATPVANVAADIAQEGAGETPVYRSINVKREAEFADVDRIRRSRQVDEMIARLYGKGRTDIWFEIPEQFRVNARARLARAEEALALPAGAKGKITDAEYQRLVANVVADLEDKKRLLEIKGMTRARARGSDWVRSRILAAKSQGVIDEAGADLVDWFIQQNPRIADELGISVRQGGGAKMGGIVGGEYSPAGRIITLFKEGGNELTAVHEVLHHTERMLPDALQAAVRKEWARQVTKVLPTVEGDARKLLQDLLVGKANPDKVMELVGEGKLPYALLNPSEFWAVNASRIVSGRYAAFNAGLVAKAKQWLTEFVQKAKGLFGLSSDAALIRGLDDVLKGDGTFVSKMLAEGEVFRSVTKADPTDYEAGKAFATAEVERLVAAGESRVGAARRVVDDLPRRLADMSDRDLGVRDALSGVSSEAKSRGLVPSGRRAAKAAEAAPSPEFVAAKETQLQALDALAEARKRARAEGYDVWSGRTPAYLDEAEEVYRKAKGEVERLIESRPLKQLGAGGEVKGMVLNEKGKNVIVLFENADASTVLHEVAHIVRAGVLSQNDMDAVTRWVATKGVQVTHQNGEFVGAADDIRKAEELFAKAFEEYVRLGSTPNTRLAKVFDVLKTAVAHTYRTVVDPVIGQGLDPEIQRVFDDLLSEVPEAEAPSIKAIVKRMMVGGVGPGEERSVVDYLAREAQRKGIAKSTFDELTKNFEQADGRVFGQAEIAKRVERGESLTDAADAVRKAFVGSKTQKLTARETGILAAVTRPSATPDPIYLSFPVPVHGKKDWTLDALTEVQRQLDLETGVAKARERGILLDLRGESRAAGGAVIEETPLERLRANIAEDDADGKLTAQTKSLLRAVTFSFFGGDVVGELGMRKLPPALRKSVDTSARIIDQSLNDIVALTNDAAEFGDPRNMYRYLGGASDVRRLNGRPIVSAGHDYMGSVQQMMRRMIEDLPDDQKAAFRQVCDAVNLPQPARGRALITLGFDESLSFSQADAAIQTTRNAAAKALTRLVQSAEVAGEPDFGSAFTKALRSAIGDVPPTVRASHEFQLAEVMSYVSGFTARNGALFKGTSEEAARVFLTDVSKIYQSEETGRRVAVIVGGYGAASLGKDVMVKMNLGISPEAYKAFNNWLVGEQWDPKYTVTIQRIVDEYGFNPQFVADNILDSTVYLPRAARERMVNSLARTTFSPSGAVGVGDGVGLAYRYMKVRMTRGNWFIKQRYYMMNTVDHFNQMGMQNGFGIAAASTARVLMQDVMVLPFWQQLVAAAMRTKAGERIGQKAYALVTGAPADNLRGAEILERFRTGLQKRGDAAANAIGSMFSASKYRIEVNPILEGVEGGFTAGGKVYSYRDVRSVAVQEGIFSSYDASQLANAIQREGALFFDTSMGGLSSITSATGKSRIKDFFADWQNTVSETAEAWSERERLGAMVTLMEFGYDPRTAARLTIDALYDYSRSMTKADRSLLTGVLFPFWAFQKNANQQVFNLIFSPSGAYRMMVLRRARERSADAITAILYNSVGNEYGVDVESMPPDLQQSYYALITKFEESYPDSEPPEDAKRAMRLLLSGRGVGVEGGRYIQTSGALQELRNAGALAELQQYAVYAAPRPEKSSRPSRFRERAGIAVTFPRTEAARLYYSLVGDDHTYMELFYPESTIEAGMKHLTQVSAAYFLLGSAGADAFLGGTLKEGGLDEVKLNRVLQSVADPSRSPLLMPLLAGTSDEFATPVRVSKVLAGATEGVLTVHPFIGKLMDDAYGTTFLRTPAKEDPFVVDPDKGEMMGVPKEAADRLRALQKQYPDAGVIRDERYRIPGGTWSILFENSPLGELNALLLRWETKPLERTALRGQILRWARGAAGFDVEEISPQATIRVEEPKKLQYTKEI